MHGEFLLIVVILVLGCAAFLVGIVCLILKCFAWCGSGLLGIFRPRGAGQGRQRWIQDKMYRVCPGEGCRKIEYRYARYCSQCGMSLAATSAREERP